MEDFCAFSALGTSKVYSEEHRKIKLIEFISLSDGKTFFGRFSLDWTETFEELKIPHRKQICLDCDNENDCKNFL